MRYLVRWAVLLLALCGCLVVARAEDAPTLDVTVNGKPLNGVHYVQKDSQLLFPVVEIARSLQRTARYDKSRHTIVVDGKEYPVVLDPDLQPPQAVEDGDTVYIDWRLLHGIFPPMKIGMGEDGVFFSCRVEPRPEVASQSTGPTTSTEPKSYWVNLHDKHRYYHTLDCPLLLKDEKLRYEVDDPEVNNLVMKRMGDYRHLLYPCPHCIKKVPLPAVKPTATPKPVVAPSVAPSPSPSASASPSARPAPAAPPTRVPTSDPFRNP